MERVETLAEKIKFQQSLCVAHKHTLDTGKRRLAELDEEIAGSVAKRRFVAKALEHAPQQLVQAEARLNQLHAINRINSLKLSHKPLRSNKALERKKERYERLLKKLEAMMNEE